MKAPRPSTSPEGRDLAAPLLPEYEAAATALYYDTVNTFMRAQSPLLDRIAAEQVSHLPQETAASDVAEGAHSKPIPVQFGAEIARDAIVILDADAWIRAAWDAATRAVEELMPRFFGAMEKIITEHGGVVVDARGGPLTWDLLIDALDKMEVNFDEEGNARDLEFMFPQEVLNGLAATPLTPDQQKRLDELMLRKREEFHASRRRRKLD